MSPTRSTSTRTSIRRFVAEDDAAVRSVAELNEEIVTRLPCSCSAVSPRKAGSPAEPMKLAASRVAAFLQRPDPRSAPSCSTGRIRSGAGTRRHRRAFVCPDFKDPFRVADLSAAALAADPARLADEAAQMSLTGGRRVVRVHGAADRLTGLFAEFP